MNKRYGIILAIVLIPLLLLAGCGGGSTTTIIMQPTVTATQTVTPTPEPTTTEPTTTPSPELTPTATQTPEPTPTATQEPEPTQTPEPTLTPEPTTPEIVFTLTSTAFSDNETYPEKFTQQGDGVSPPLSWSNVPEGTVSFALLMKDPNTARGIFTHWVIFNIPADVYELAEGIPASLTLENGAIQSTNSFRMIGYGSPNLVGGIHHYVFIIYALDTTLTLTSYDSITTLIPAMEGHILAEAILVGVIDLTETE